VKPIPILMGILAISLAIPFMFFVVIPAMNTTAVQEDPQLGVESDVNEEPVSELVPEPEIIQEMQADQLPLDPADQFPPGRLIGALLVIRSPSGPLARNAPVGVELTHEGLGESPLLRDAFELMNTNYLEYVSRCSGEAKQGCDIRGITPVPVIIDISLDDMIEFIDFLKPRIDYDSVREDGVHSRDYGIVATYKGVKYLVALMAQWD